MFQEIWCRTTKFLRHVLGMLSRTDQEPVSSYDSLILAYVCAWLARLTKTYVAACCLQLDLGTCLSVFSVRSTQQYTLFFLLAFSCRMNRIMSLISFNGPFHKCDKNVIKNWLRHFQDSGAGRITVLRYITCDSNMSPEWQCLDSPRSPEPISCPMRFQGCHPIQCPGNGNRVCSGPADLRRSIFLSLF